MLTRFPLSLSQRNDAFRSTCLPFVQAYSAADALPYSLFICVYLHACSAVRGFLSSAGSGLPTFGVHHDRASRRSFGCCAATACLSISSLRCISSSWQTHNQCTCSASADMAAASVILIYGPLTAQSRSYVWLTVSGPVALSRGSGRQSALVPI